MTTLKTFTFAIMHFSVAFTVAYLLTGSIAIGGLIAAVEPAVNTVAFFFHELIWKRIEAQKKAKQSADTAADNFGISAICGHC